MFTSQTARLGCCCFFFVIFARYIFLCWFRVSGACLLQVDEGPCREEIERYYYNTISQKCEIFYYGGCQGNANNFNSYQKCQKTCFRIPSKISVCLSCTYRVIDERVLVVKCILLLEIHLKNDEMHKFMLYVIVILNNIFTFVILVRKVHKPLELIPI